MRNGNECQIAFIEVQSNYVIALIVLSEQDIKFLFSEIAYKNARLV